LHEGDHVFSPVIRLHASGQGGTSVSIQGGSRSLQVSSRRVQADPSRFEFGDLKPGMEQYHELTLTGNFPSSRGRLVVESRSDVPECVTFELSGVGEGEPQPINPGQTYTVAVRVAPYCGPSAFKRALDTALRIEFDRASHSAPVPTVIVPIRATLINELGIPDSISTTIKAGEVKDLNVRLGRQERDLSFEALFPPRSERARWPGKDLDLAFVDDRGRTIRVDRQIATSHGITFEKTRKTQSTPLTLRVISNPCCSGGVYKTELALVPRSGSTTPVRVPVEITVEEAGLWSCWGPTIFRGFLLILLLLLLAYLINMYKSSHFLKRDLLADRLVPLRWDEYGQAKPHTRASNEVRRMVRRDLSFFKRARAWFKANPLVFGLPGQDYYESVELRLNQFSDVSRSSVQLTATRDIRDEITRSPSQGRGKVYATAKGGVAFFAVPDRNRLSAGLEIEQEFGSVELDEEEFELKVVSFRRRTELTLAHGEREPDTMAGWRVG
ncbi:MAG: hypothetical protein ACNA8W_07565, partial [Bradymonadaceae bacterium]